MAEDLAQRIAQMRPGFMIDLLAEAEKALPPLLASPDGWSTLYADSEKPTLLRMWRSWEGYRIYGHKLLPCLRSEALFHPHPWPFAVRILQGSYEELLAAGDPTANLISGMSVFGRGAVYERMCPTLWHAVRPIAVPCWSFMVTGLPWSHEKQPSNTPTRPLTRTEMELLLCNFRCFYPK